MQTRLRSITQSGMLRKNGFWFQFQHRTFQEYFAGRALARQFVGGICLDEREEMDTALQDLKHQPQHQRMLGFMIEEALRLSVAPEKDAVLMQLLGTLSF